MGDSVVSLTAARGRKVGRLTLLTDVDARTGRKRDYLLKGILSPGEMSAVYGEPGCGKTFLALYLARCVCAEREAFGRRVHATPVLYLALEGVTGFETRLRAEIDRHEMLEDFSYIAEPINLFSDAHARANVLEAIGLCDAGLVIVDTLNRALGEGSENDPGDMGQFIQNIDAIRTQTGAHVMIIHHSGKDSTKGMRGHSALQGAADVVIEVIRDPDKAKPRTAVVRKAKDDADGTKFTFDLEVVDLGLDDDGDRITTCVVREADQDDANADPKTTLKAEERQWLTQLHELFAREGTTTIMKPERGASVAIPVATRRTVREWFRVRGLFAVADEVRQDAALTSTDRSKFTRVLNALRDKKKIGIHGDKIWLVN